MKISNQKMEIITCSEVRDFERCTRLCDSVDRFVDRAIGHTIVVPARDMTWFRPFEGGRRRVMAMEEVLPTVCHQLPLLNKLWMDGRGWPIRNQALKRVTRLNANRITNSEMLLFADSGIQFVRPLATTDFVNGNELRMAYRPSETDLNNDSRNTSAVAALLGLADDNGGTDFDSPLTSWRRSNLISLHAHLEEVNGEPWYTSVMNNADISESSLYGTYVDAVLGREEARHFYIADELCHQCVFRQDADALVSGASMLSPRAIALTFCRNLNLDITSERAIASTAMSRQLLSA